MGREKWKYLPIAKEQYSQIKDLIELFPEFGYSSIPEFVRFAIRNQLAESEVEVRRHMEYWLPLIAKKRREMESKN